MKKYKSHCFFIVFDFRSDEIADTAVDLIRHGETRIFLKFRENLPHNIMAVAYMQFDNILRLDVGRNAIMDYTM